MLDLCSLQSRICRIGRVLMHEYSVEMWYVFTVTMTLVTALTLLLNCRLSTLWSCQYTFSWTFRQSSASNHVHLLSTQSSIVLTCCRILMSLLSQVMHSCLLDTGRWMHCNSNANNLSHPAFHNWYDHNSIVYSDKCKATEMLKEESVGDDNGSKMSLGVSWNMTHSCVVTSLRTTCTRWQMITWLQPPVRAGWHCRVQSTLPSNRRHLRCDDWRIIGKVIRTVQFSYCVPQLYTVISPHIWTVLTGVLGPAVLGLVYSLCVCVFLYVFLTLFILSCQCQCKWLTRKTCLWNDI